MKTISKKDINIASGLVVLIGISVVGGFIKWPFLILAGILTFSYILFDRQRLRCPNCGGFENLDRLSYAKNHVHHCRHCGERINISQ